jgi:RNA polymerase sigma factor (sigma-70 family)
LVDQFQTIRISSLESRRKIFPAAATILTAMLEATPSPRPAEPTTGPIDWATALATHDRWLRTAVLARLGERQAVEEVMQNVALAAVAQRAPLAEPAKVASWLYRLAVTKVLLYRRECGRRHKLVGRYALSGHQADRNGHAPDPLDWLLLDERQKLVRAALRHLPGRDAEILLLKYTEDLSYRELAEHLGIAESAVESRLHRARHRLRLILAGDASTKETEARK